MSFSPVSLVLNDFSSNVIMDICGQLYTEGITTLTSDATAVFYAYTEDFQKVFKYAIDSDSFDFSDNTLNFFTDMNNWPNDNSYPFLKNSSTAMLDQPLSTGAISTYDANGSYAADSMLINDDFIRYLSYKLFNTPYGVELFVNLPTMLANINYICGTDISSNVGYNIFNVLNKVSTDASLNSVNPNPNLVLYHVDGETDIYSMTNSDTSSANICRELMLQLFTLAPTRFANVVHTISPQSAPFVDGDTLSYLMTLNAAPNQHLLTGLTIPIPPRTYKISIVLINNSSPLTNTIPHGNLFTPVWQIQPGYESGSVIGGEAGINPVIMMDDRTIIGLFQTDSGITRIWKSTNAGYSFTDLGWPDGAWGNNCLTASEDASVVYASNYNPPNILSIYRNSTWTTLSDSVNFGTASPNFNMVICSLDGSRVWVNTSPNIYYSSSYGASGSWSQLTQVNFGGWTWIQYVPNYRDTEPDTVFVSGVLAGEDANSTTRRLYKIDNQNNFTLLSTTFPNIAPKVSANGQYIIGIGTAANNNSCIYTSSDFGSSFVTQLSGGYVIASTTLSPSGQFQAVGTNSNAVNGFGASVLVSTNYGSSWVIQTDIPYNEYNGHNGGYSSIASCETLLYTSNNTNSGLGNHVDVYSLEHWGMPYLI